MGRFYYFLGASFLSGAASLAYQFLWLKKVSLLFGNTAQVAGITFGMFFAGLALGSKLFGNLAKRSNNPLRLYALLELAIALTACLFFIVPTLFKWSYISVFQSDPESINLFFITLSASALLVFPASFFMGGTIPVTLQATILRASDFARRGTILYTANLLGAVAGTIIASFFLPMWLGYSLAFGCIICLSLSIALSAWYLSRNTTPISFELFDQSPPQNQRTFVQKQSRQQRRQKQRSQTSNTEAPKINQSLPRISGILVSAVALFSGFSILILEVIWTRLFAQILENSVYSYSALLCAILVGLAVGSALSSLISNLKVHPRHLLVILFTLAGLTVVGFPWLFLRITDGMMVISSSGRIQSHTLLIFARVLLCTLPVTMTAGAIFPLLMKLTERQVSSPGKMIGSMSFANTAGAAVGSFLGGFVLMQWMSPEVLILTVGCLYLLAALLFPQKPCAIALTNKAIALLTLIIAIASAKSIHFPVIGKDPQLEFGKVVEKWPGIHGDVTVNKLGRDFAIRLNSQYSLGSLNSSPQESFQGILPFLIHPQARDVFFLGMGTGITAGSALNNEFAKVDSVTVCELVPEVIKASKKYFTAVRGLKANPQETRDFTEGLHKDDRARIISGDGRHFLMASAERFDIINSDLFVPYRSGIGSLYSLEHFINVKARLKPNGIFVQWLPLYQLTKNEAGIIAKTMIEAFDLVTIWRHNFQPGQEVIGLVGHQTKSPLPASKENSYQDRSDSVRGKNVYDIHNLNFKLSIDILPLFYAGNLSEAQKVIDQYPVNTDDKPYIEYLAPKSFRANGLVENPWFTGIKLASFLDQIDAACTLEDDPYLSLRNHSAKSFARAGQSYHKSMIYLYQGNEEKAQTHWSKFVKLWTVN